MSHAFHFSRLLLVIVLATAATSPFANALSAMPKKVVVSGAGGQTGKSLFRQLLQDDDFMAFGIVRTQTSKDTLLEEFPMEDDGRIVVCDVTDEASVKSALDWNTVDALCICTSGTPRPTGETREDGRPIFGYPEGGDPEIVDWMGQKSQIDAMAEASSSASSAKHVVVCSSMGGTDPDNMLNALGRSTDPETGKVTGGNILLWKRKSEKYLIEQSSDNNLKHTIVHPGGLINEPANQRTLIVGVDDDRVTYGGEGSPRTVPRDDVARVMLEACRHPSLYGNRSFDLRAHEPEGDSPSVSTDFSKLLDSLEGKNCDYSLGTTM
jgi:nucleoside-diphosphate-sugar epimerase